MDAQAAFFASSEVQDAKLRRIKTAATSLLLVVAAGYVAATMLEPQHRFFAYLAATCEAAMIGALADWFAVVALFRHPLNLSFIPHTAVISKNRTRIARGISQFIEEKFLSTSAIVEKIKEMNPAEILSSWLLKPANADLVADYLSRLLSYTLTALDDQRVRHFLQQALTAKLHQMDLSRALGELLGMLTESNRHHAVLDQALASLDEYLARPATRLRLAEEISRQVPLLQKVSKYLHIDLDEKAALKLLDIACAKIDEVSRDKDHELRKRFDEAVAEFVRKLKEEESVKARIHQVRNELLENPTIAEYVEGLWDGMKAWINADIASQTSVLRRNLHDMARTLGARIQADESIKEWINEQILTAAPPYVEEHRSAVGRFVERQIHQWNEETLVRELERQIGPDLQYIRINGTIVGAAVGLAIYSVTQLF
jgi:uncharacterized membrane-anchored protein YjiN (DUF445 family)